MTPPSKPSEARRERLPGLQKALGKASKKGSKKNQIPGFKGLEDADLEAQIQASTGPFQPPPKDTNFGGKSFAQAGKNLEERSLGGVPLGITPRQLAGAGIAGAAAPLLAAGGAVGMPLALGAGAIEGIGGGIAMGGSDGGLGDTLMNAGTGMIPPVLGKLLGKAGVGSSISNEIPYGQFEPPPPAAPGGGASAPPLSPPPAPRSLGLEPPPRAETMFDRSLRSRGGSLLDALPDAQPTQLSGVPKFRSPSGNASFPPPKASNPNMTPGVYDSKMGFSMEAPEGLFRQGGARPNRDLSGLMEAPQAFHEPGGALVDSPLIHSQTKADLSGLMQAPAKAMPPPPPPSMRNPSVAQDFVPTQTIPPPKAAPQQGGTMSMKAPAQQGGTMATYAPELGPRPPSGYLPPPPAAAPRPRGNVANGPKVNFDEADAMMRQVQAEGGFEPTQLTTKTELVTPPQNVTPSSSVQQPTAPGTVDQLRDILLSARAGDRGSQGILAMVAAALGLGGGVAAHAATSEDVPSVPLRPPPRPTGGQPAPFATQRPYATQR